MRFLNEVKAITYKEGGRLLVHRADGSVVLMQPVPPKPHFVKAELPFSFWLGVNGHWGYDG